MKRTLIYEYLLWPFLEIRSGSRYAKGMIKTKRAYEQPSSSDGARYLVDRLWPRGVKRESLEIQDWLKEAAPSNDLRKQFHHDPQRWEEFCQRYFAELDSSPEAIKPLLEAAHRGDVTLVYGARDEEHNNAAALKAYLEKRLK